MIAKFVKTILFIFIFILLTAPFVHAVVLESGIPNTDLKPGTDIQDITIAQYINYIYLFVLGVVGIAVFASLVFWGVVWISSGIADKRGMALGKIKDAFTGLAIALGAYIILNTINPDLLTLRDLSENKVATSTATTRVISSKGNYFWSNTCDGMSGVISASSDQCANTSCNAGGPDVCKQLTGIMCCYLQPHIYTYTTTAEFTPGIDEFGYVIKTEQCSSLGSGWGDNLSCAGSPYSTTITKDVFKCCIKRK